LGQSRGLKVQCISEPRGAAVNRSFGEHPPRGGRPWATEKHVRSGWTRHEHCGAASQQRWLALCCKKGWRWLSRDRLGPGRGIGREPRGPTWEDEGFARGHQKTAQDAKPDPGRDRSPLRISRWKNQGIRPLWAELCEGKGPRMRWGPVVAKFFPQKVERIWRRGRCDPCS